MKNYKIPALLIMLVTIVGIDAQIFFGANGLSLMTKLLIIGLTAVGQLIATMLVLLYKPKSQAEAAIKPARERTDEKNYKIPALLIMLVTVVGIDAQIFFGANGLSLKTKLLIIGVTAVGQLVATMLVLLHKPKSKTDMNRQGESALT